MNRLYSSYYEKSWLRVLRLHYLKLHSEIRNKSLIKFEISCTDLFSMFFHSTFIPFQSASLCRYSVFNWRPSLSLLLELSTTGYWIIQGLLIDSRSHVIGGFMFFSDILWIRHIMRNKSRITIGAAKSNGSNNPIPRLKTICITSITTSSLNQCSTLVTNYINLLILSPWQEGHRCAFFVFLEKL